jgi:predicted MFS family arabinose efflux permease
MVEQGQPRGITGMLQSVQRGSMYGAMILTGWLGGYLAANGMQTTGFAICAGTALGSFLLAVFVVEEPPPPERTGSAMAAIKELWTAAKHPAVLGVGAFLFLINFNPFGADVRYIHIVEGIGLGEQAYGRMVSIQAIAAVAATATYGSICRRVPFRFLIHGCIVATIIATFFWWGLSDALSAGAIAAGYGFVMMLTSLVQLDMAARYCPPAIAATVFALLMSLCNGAVSTSAILGGTLYEKWGATMGRPGAFSLLVALGAGFTCLCWLIVPHLNKLEQTGPSLTTD